MPVKLCAHPSCPSPATYRGRCAEHARTTNRDSHSKNRRIYNSKRWQMARRGVLSEQPLCPGVFDESCGRIATDVHHIKDIDDGGDPWARTNLVALCHAHHSQITRRDQAWPPTQ
jgi:5-methylcytosine-specific restriction endonuclease McrA